MAKTGSMLLCLLFLLPLDSSGQFSLNEFLGHARNDVRFQEYNLKSKFLEKNPYRSPWIQRTEFRIRTNDLNISADDYRFRINPTNPFEIRANRKYYEMEFDFLLTEFQKAMNAALNERYMLIIDLLSGINAGNLKQRQINLLMDEIRTLEALSADPDFNLSEYIQARENLIEARLELNGINHAIEQIEFEIRYKYEFTGNLDAGSVVVAPTLTIRKWLNTIFDGLDTAANILITSVEQNNRLAEQRLKIESAEDRRNIGFIQAEYDRDRGNEMEEHLGFQVGIRIPLTNPDRPDMNRDKIDLLEDQAGLVERKAEISLQANLIRLRLAYLFDQYELILTEIAENDFPDIMVQSPELEPRDLIRAQRSVLRLERLENDLKWDIYRSYIEYLYYSGRLVDMPLKNYLSPGLDEI